MWGLEILEWRGGNKGASKRQNVPLVWESPRE